MMTELTLRAGTLHYVQDGSGGLSGPFRLESDVQVDLLSSGPSWRVYERPGDPSWLYVKPQDDAPAPADAN